MVRKKKSQKFALCCISRIDFWGFPAADISAGRDPGKEGPERCFFTWEIRKSTTLSDVDRDTIQKLLTFRFTLAFGDVWGTAFRSCLATASGIGGAAFADDLQYLGPVKKISTWLLVWWCICMYLQCVVFLHNGCWSFAKHCGLGVLSWNSSHCFFYLSMISPLRHFRGSHRQSENVFFKWSNSHRGNLGKNLHCFGG